MPALLAVDTGGTFTDLVLSQGDDVHVVKVLSTPADPSRAILDGIDRLGAPSLDEVVHGSTVATNAVLERRGARAAFVTNARFTDLLNIGRQNRPNLYDLSVQRPPALISSSHSFGVGVGLTPDGEVRQPLDAAEVERLSKALRDGDYESLAVCFLHSYANGSPEAELRDRLEATLPDLQISISSEVLPQYREYERACATALNAYVQPTMRQYLTRLNDRVGAKLLVVQSDGGMVGTDEAGARPVHTLLSGPAAGAVGAHRAGLANRRSSLIAFDMGGTSTDVSLVDGAPSMTRESSIGGVPLAVSTIDVHSVGAGGGSIAWLDRAGALKVGPQSSGADPGPACYGRGELATVTDAHVVLGRLPAHGFLGGQMELDEAAARRAVGRIGAALGCAPDAAAQGIIAVTNAHMARAIKVISLERGHDPRDFDLVAFGGAGGLHAADLADSLGIDSVLIPPTPGLLSAAGMLGADLTREASRTVFERFDPGQLPTVEQIAALKKPLVETAQAFLEAHAVAPQNRVLDTVFDCRYAGQSFELAVSPDGPETDFIEAFHRQHAWRYGYRLDRAVEWVALRVRGRGRRGADVFESATAPTPTQAPVSDDRGPWPAWARAQLPARYRLSGPAVVTEYSATTWIPPGWELEVLTSGALSLSALGHRDSALGARPARVVT